MAARAQAKTTDGLLASISDESLAHAISRYSGGQPQRTGSGWMVRCPNPSHEDKNPACSVNRKGGVALWHCFVCGNGGNAISWFRVAKGERESFPELMQELAGEFGSHIGANENTQGARRGSRSAPRQEPQEHVDFAQRMRAEVATGGEASDLLVKFSRQKRLSIEHISASGVHTAFRRHLCTPDHCVTEQERWTSIIVIRVPVMGADGAVVGWQDILTRDDADNHFYGQNKRTASGCQFPAVGVDVAAQQKQNRILLVEGVTDWLTARAAAPGWVVVGALGASQMCDTAAALQKVSTVNTTTLVVVGDGDTPGDNGANAAVAEWAGMSTRLRPSDGTDISDMWVQSFDAGMPDSWWGQAISEVVDYAESHRGGAWEMPEVGKYDAPTVYVASGHKQHPVGDLPIWPGNEVPPNSEWRIVVVVIDEKCVVKSVRSRGEHASDAETTSEGIGIGVIEGLNFTRLRKKTQFGNFRVGSLVRVDAVHKENGILIYPNPQSVEMLNL